MNKLFGWFRSKTIWLLSIIITLFGSIATRFVSCGTNTIVVTNQIVTNPTNQIMAVEASSFVANLFYEGPDDPFATPGIGGEVGKITHVALRKGETLFEKALVKIVNKTEKIIITSRVWRNSQIQEGARSLDKKIGHALKNKTISAFEGVPQTQASAEKIIIEIINKPDAIVIRPYLTKIYNAKGQGLSFDTQSGGFVGFVERSLEKEL